MLLYFWLNSPELAQERVKTRVREGGHFIPPDVIERRYWQGINRLFDSYLPLVNKTLVFDNLSGTPILLAEKSANSLLIIRDKLYHQLLLQYESRKAV